MLARWAEGSRQQSAPAAVGFGFQLGVDGFVLFFAEELFCYEPFLKTRMGSCSFLYFSISSSLR